MILADLLEEIRTLLREPQSAVGVPPQTYADADLYLQVRSALRHLVARGVVTDFTVDVTGAVAGTLANDLGIVLALRCASVLLRGDLIQQVISGRMGVVFQMGNDLIDTKTAAIQFKEAAQSYDDEYAVMLAVLLTPTDGSVFGGPLAPFKLNLG